MLESVMGMVGAASQTISKEEEEPRTTNNESQEPDEDKI